MKKKQLIAQKSDGVTYYRDLKGRFVSTKKITTNDVVVKEYIGTGKKKKINIFKEPKKVFKEVKLSVIGLSSLEAIAMTDFRGSFRFNFGGFSRKITSNNIDSLLAFLQTYNGKIQDLAQKKGYPSVQITGKQIIFNGKTSNLYLDVYTGGKDFDKLANIVYDFF